MSRCRTRLALALFAAAALAGGALVASGEGSTAQSWAWEEGVPGDPVAGGPTGERLLVAAGDVALVGASRQGTLEVGAGSGEAVALQPLDELAGDDPLVAFSATTPEGGPQQLVGVARGDVDRVEAVLRDGTAVELPLNEWRAFSYTARAASESAVGLVARSGDDEIGVVRVPQTTGATTGPPPPTSYTVSNRGRPVPVRETRLGAPLFAVQPYRLSLLATRNGRAFYRVQVTPRYTCWGAGKASRIGEIGVLGCPALVGAYPLQFEDVAYGAHLPSTRPKILRAGGIAVDQAAAVALLDRSGRPVAVAPVVDNVYSFPGPFPKSAGLARVALDASGNRLAPRLGDRQQTPPPGIFGPRARRVEATRLGVVAQRGTSGAVTVSVGRNGVVVLGGSVRSETTRRALARGDVGFHCFVVKGQNVRETRDVWLTARWRPPVAFRVTGFPPPFDGCDVQGTYGHLWRDGRGTHSLVEVPLTERGRVYFEDRAAARDLALFVRSRRTRELRTLTGARLVAALRRAYGNDVVVLSSRSATAPAGAVGVRVDGAKAVFSERSATGNRLFVELERGKIVSQNLRGLAFVS